MKHEIIYLSRNDVEQTAVTMREVIDAVENMFRLKGLGLVEMPPKPGIHTRKDSFLHAMPAYIKGQQEAAGIKWVGGYPDNPAKGLPYITGLFILNDPETGLPLSVMDCTWITAMRTGAATAISAKYLARRNSTSVGIIGCGVQGKSNLLALNELFDIEKVCVYDRYIESAKAYCQQMENETGLAINVVDSPQQAVSGMDIVVTAGLWTNEPLAVIKPGWLDEGAFASPVDMDSYWSPDAIAQADIFCLDDLSQYDNFSRMGCFTDFPKPNRDLGKIVAGFEKGRENNLERIIGLNIGMALDDVAVAPIIYEQALQKKIGTKFAL